MTDQHLSETDIAAYIDGVVAADDRRRMEAHLVWCDACRTEMVASQSAVFAAPPVGRRTRGSWTWAGAAAAAAVIVVAGSILTQRADDRDVVRSAPSPAPATRPVVTVVSPGDGQRLGADRKLVWRSAGTGASYRITIGDDSGQPVHSMMVQDTSVTLPASVPLASGKKFFWYVDASLPGGATATSGLVSFTVE